MAEPSEGSLALDTSTLVNFIRADRLDIIAGSWAEIHIVEEVEMEVTNLLQRERLQNAIQNGLIQIYRVTNLSDIEIATKLVDEEGLGRGEAFSFITARNLGAKLAIDDELAIKRASKRVPGVTVLSTIDIVIRAIHMGILSTEDADAIKEDWGQNHRFKIKIATFADLLGR